MKHLYLGCFAFIVLVLAISSLHGEFNRTTGLIDIPTAYILPAKVWKFNMNGSVAIGTENIWEKKPADMDFSISYGLYNKAEVSLSMFTFRDYVLDLTYLLTSETENVPAIAFGIQNLTYSRFITEVGRGDKLEDTEPEEEQVADQRNGWGDDETYPRRCSEQFSVYFVMSKTFSTWGQYHLGIGRGRFVGYGSRSKYFNSDIYSDTEHNDAIGLFWGAAFDFFQGFGPMIDFDGRDFNIGLQYRSPYFRISLAAVKLEHRLGGMQSLAPRFAIGGSATTQAVVEERAVKQVGILAGKVWNKATAKPLKAVVSFPGAELGGIISSEKSGSFKLTLPAGVYVVRSTVKGYYWKQKKVRIAPGKTTICNFAMKKKTKKGTK
ncbi:MAG: hypothetical protein E3J78_02065 [Candidatus Cloacimonadota bacterium]|nr:MAG: hypothetical protein E3J78_02065 [Candidatus Cloacimonadota bacterium]